MALPKFTGLCILVARHPARHRWAGRKGVMGMCRPQTRVP